ncbi:MAG: NADP-dependent malic enzyme [Thermomonas sp.]|mgnify:CR=1 FL=1|jgi:malate dehydrogenase (oxaloacetate-decarboxylating)(NADP+)|uniref:NADP-dependent malic enzyme n=1 Tax=Thermomonas sp. TaxID=1971895 RepID=UPI001B5AA517|nr:NADP-dependent malic enzyme [Thermomonas sp.]MBK6416499.1 NADP-dependent malic enzyme [Thermomonas sp.]MBK6926011.1 NADP-dependent malic enzyme [Thermomonas sp.]MBP6439505.1 NADP-dependent malic enzyme [Thermomonas sp.]MBP7157900.1 NADP-dependent malic enzyme [Thermomonas sp.]MBP7789371.1 NADP-dependent malic enzyme [Thermomonas sp.]
MSDTPSNDELKQAALDYHRLEPRGKIKVAATKPMVTQRDLALAYSPGVAYACEAIVADPNEVSSLTARGNLVGVITNGTAVLGLGDIGALAGKPVMEGKGVLFQKFAGIDVFDIELNERDPDKLVEIIAAMEPTFGGINLEDIKAPECFIVERKLRERMNIPVFHDDQHGTAIIVGAAVLNALEVAGKKIEEVRLATSGAGAAGIACLDMLVALGMKPEHILAVDRDGVLYTGREHLDPDKQRYARDTDKRSLAEIVAGADIFLGLSAGGVLKPEMVAAMAERPIILALANPYPEILPEDARAVRPDCIIATGRSDYPNQVNNALCFPYIFRGALDAGATEINEAMKLACVRAIAALARKEASDLGSAYGGEVPKFGAEYLIPRPFDPRLLTMLAPAVAQAAMDSGIAQRPIADLDAYRETLAQFIYRTSLMMKPVYERARKDKKRVAYAEGEEHVVLQAVQTVIDEGLAFPILIGRPGVIENRIAKLGLRMKAGVDFELTNIGADPRFDDYWRQYHALTERRGVTPSAARNLLRSRPTIIAALMVERGEADAMITGIVGRFHKKLGYLRSVFDFEPGVTGTAAMTGVINDHGAWFFVDTHVQLDPTAEQIAEATLMASYRLKLFGIEPKVALLSHSNFGSHQDASALKMRRAFEIIRARMPKLEIDGEMMADTAWDEALRQRIFPNTRLKGRANLLVMPNLDAANIGYNMIRVATGGVAIGPILMGLDQPAHILTPASSSRRVVNMTAIAAVEAQIRASMGASDKKSG